MRPPRTSAWSRASFPIEGEAVRGARLVLTLGAGLLLPGCGAGGGHSGPAGGGSDLNGVASGVSVSELGGGRIEVRFLLTTPVQKQVGVDVAFSQDRGGNYSGATLEAAPAQPGALPASPDGIPHSVVWRADADLTNQAQHDLRVRISPYDSASRAGGVSGLSPVFGIGAGSPPSITALTTPGGARGGWISFSYTAADADGDYVGLDGEYSLDNGVTFRPATLGRGDGSTAVTADPAGSDHAISWHAQEDAPDLVGSNARLRLRAMDTAPGAFATSGRFSLDTRGPAIDLLTIDAVGADMNGSTPFTNTSGQSQAFTLLATRQGFVVWLTFSTGGSAIDPAGLSVSADVPLGGGAVAGGADSGESIGGRFGVDAARGLATLTVPPELAFPLGLDTITAQVSDMMGNSSAPVSFTLEAGTATPDRRPFESADRWHVDFTRDNFAISSSIDSLGNATVTSTAGRNGVADFVEDLRVLGLQSASPPQPARDAQLNEVVLLSIEEAVLGRLNELYGRNFDGSAGSDSAAVEFTAAAPAGTHSRIAVGGDDPVPGYTLGRAEFDYRNSGPNDDADADLGVFTTNLIDFYINSSFTFRSRFNPFIPGRGTPLGFHADDLAVLSPSFDRSSPGNTTSENRRYDDLAAAIDAMGRVTAVILAHEVGHSVGLMANGAPPAGLFGGEYQASFARTYTNAYHLDTAQNDIMAASLSFSAAIITGGGRPRFNELTLAYLLERILLD